MSSLDSIRQVYRRILPSITPESFCVLCGEVCGGSSQSLICEPCLSDLPVITTPCSVCSVTLSAKDSAGMCGSCLQTKPFYQKSVIPLEYTFPITELIKQLKYNDKLLFSEILSQSVLDKIRQESRPLPEVIIPVPLHPFRLMKRGFNQSALIAKNISTELNIPIDLKSCRRIRNTLQQTGFNKSKRKKNIRNAFSVSSKFSAKHVAILDDVVTTGSTVNELARVLQQAGAETIEVWACARTISD